MKRLLQAGGFALAMLALAGCARTGYPGFGSPKDTLVTFFDSARGHDYATTYSSYDDTYQQQVTREEFVQHRAQASALKEYSVGPVVVNGNSAEASVTLTFVSGTGAARDVAVRENLVKQGPGWKIKVW